MSIVATARITLKDADRDLPGAFGLGCVQLLEGVAMERSEMLAKVAEVAADVLGINEDEITEETTFDDLDADSLDRLQLVTAFEDEFDIEIPEDRLLSISSVGDALDAIEASQEA